MKKLAVIFLVMTTSACIAQEQKDRTILILEKGGMFCENTRTLLITKDNKIHVICALPVTALTLQDQPDSRIEGFVFPGDPFNVIIEYLK